MAKQRVVILGAGYAGIMALKTLQKHQDIVAITLVEKHDYHYEAASIHEVASGAVTGEKISYKIQDILQEETQFIQGNVQHIVKEKKQVYLEDGRVLAYDFLIIALGFISETFGIKGAETFALQMTDIETAEKIYQHILAKLEDYKITKNPDNLRIIICGAGFTGIELLGSLGDERKKYAKIAEVPEDAFEFSCMEGGTTILPMFSEDLREYTQQAIEKENLRLLTGCVIQEVQNGKVLFERNNQQEEITAGTIIWTTGVSGNLVISESAYKAKRNRVAVTEMLADPEDDHVFLVGDVSVVLDTQGKPYPATAQIAMKMGRHAAKNILESIKGGSLREFQFKSQGTVASIGNANAVGQVGTTEVKGYPASALKKMIVDKSLLEEGGLKELLAKGRFDFYR